MKTIDPLKTRLHKTIGHGSPLLGCRFDPSGRFLFVSAQDDTIQRIDLATNQKTPFIGHKSWVRGIAFTANFPTPTPLRDNTLHAALEGGVTVAAEESRHVRPFFIASGDYHGNLLWWEGHDPRPRPIHSVAAHDGWIRAVVSSPDNSLVASCGNDRLVKLWSSADGRHVHTFEGHESHVYNVAFHPDRQNLVSADHHGIVKQWDLKSLKHVRDLEAKTLHKYDGNFLAHIGGIRGMIFDMAGTTLACCGITNVTNAFAGVGNPGVVVFDWNNGKGRPLTPKDAYQGTGWGVLLHEGYAIAAGGAADGRIWFWKLSDGSPVTVLKTPTNARDLALHPSGTAIAVAGQNGNAMIYSIAAV